eukprot:jgi/Ulvmu1/8311/UM042_0017.1
MKPLKCQKCLTQIAQIISECGRLCAECLTAAVQAKLSKTLKVYDGLVHGDQIVAAVSGGPSSMALAHLLSHFCVLDWSRPHRGKVSCKIHVVHVDESAAVGASASRTSQWLSALEPQLRASLDIMTLHVIPLQDVCSGTPEEKLACLQKTLNTAKDATSREDLRKSLRMRLLQSVAQTLQCNKILVGESCTKLASNFIAAAAKGQGFSAVADMHLADARDSICVMKPLLHLSSKELALYCFFNKRPFFADPLSSSSATFRSINDLTDSFIADLSGKNRGGVSNIAKTAAKLPPFAFNDARLAGAPPLRHLMQTRVRGVPESKQLSPAIEEACQQDRQILCQVCRRPCLDGQSASARQNLCASCAQWVLPDSESDPDAPHPPRNSTSDGKSGSHGEQRDLAWLADAIPKLQLG